MNAGKRADLKAGDELWVPAGDVSQLRAGLGSDMERRMHRVKNGESLWSISRRYGMTVQQLARMNHVSIEVRAAARPAPAGRRQRRQRAVRFRFHRDDQGRRDRGKVNYKVKRGDTLSGIARRFAVTVRDLQAWNNMGGSTALRAGQFLTIHVGGMASVGG